MQLLPQLVQIVHANAHLVPLRLMGLTIAAPNAHALQNPHSFSSCCKLAAHAPVLLQMLEGCQTAATVGA